MQPQKAGCTGSFGLSVTVPKGCTEHPWKQPGLAGPRGSSSPSPSWRQPEQSPGVRREQGEDTCLPGLQHRRHPMHKVPARAGSQSPLGGRGPCMLCQQVVWLLPDTGLPQGCCCGMGLPQAALPGRALPAWGHPARRPPAWALPARGFRVAQNGQDDSPPPSAPWKNSWELPDPTAAGSRRVSPAWLSPSRCQPPPPLSHSLPCTGS